MTTTAQLLSLERKMKMYQAREAILSRIGTETFSVINLDHFLQATVTEVGKMMDVDRCDVMTLTPENAFPHHTRISRSSRRAGIAFSARAGSAR